MKEFFLQRWCGLQQQTTVKKPEGETVTIATSTACEIVAAHVLDVSSRA